MSRGRQSHPTHRRRRARRDQNGSREARLRMSLIRQFVSVGGATLASRLLGFVRETMIANALGAGPVADAFYAAFRFPNLFRRLFAEGAFNAAFIPLFARTLEGEGEEAARKFAEDVLAALLLVLMALTAVVMIATPLDRDADRAGLHGERGKVRSDRRAFPDHVPLSHLHVADGDGHRRAQRLPKILRRGDRPASPQRHRSIGARAGSGAGTRYRVGRAAPLLVDSGRRRRAASLGGDGGAPHRLHCALPASAADARREAAALACRSRRGGRRHHPDQSLRRPDHRLRTRRARSPSCNMPTGSTSCRSAWSASPSASCSCRSCRAR